MGPATPGGTRNPHASAPRGGVHETPFPIFQTISGTGQGIIRPPFGWGFCQLTGAIDSPGLAMSIDMAMPTNRPHFHVWLQAKTGRMFYKCRPFHTRQTAREWAMRRQAESEKRLVLKCELDACRPKLKCRSGIADVVTALGGQPINVSYADLRPVG